jgi:DNA mismatch repair protein MutL
MADFIKLLPDSVANQIAAGEVIQRPASAVKELLENAVDAGATHIQLVIKDAGKTLIQVIDNGQGMSETDARLCFERHATSKISQASDLFSIRTMGFRGEALASVAAIARVELKTRTAADALGTEVVVEGSVILSHRACQCPVGTNISVKNLFFNTPARRNFLKGDQVERNHILQEFQRVALSRPDLAMMLYQNGQLTHQLDGGRRKQRIVNLFGNHYNQRLVPVGENTELVSLEGFVVKPEFARKKRGEQYFFVNQRYIRSPYLSHAVESAYEELIPEDMFPSFFIYLEVDPDQVDVNVHPTKTEIKFQDERYLYQVLKAAVKRALGKYNIAPSLDFDRETAFDNLGPAPESRPSPPRIRIDPDYNPFTSPGAAGRPAQGAGNRVDPESWEKLFAPGAEEKSGPGVPVQTRIQPDWDDQEHTPSQKKFLQLQNRYILVPVRSGLMVIDQHRAHERVLFERIRQAHERQKGSSQQLLFPETIRLAEAESALLESLLPQMKDLGFGISRRSGGSYVVDSVPAQWDDPQGLQEMMEGLLEQFQKNRMEIRDDIATNLARSLAKRLSLKYGKVLGQEEMGALTEDLFACSMPYQSPAGKPTVRLLTMEELGEKFK